MKKDVLNGLNFTWFASSDIYILIMKEAKQ